MTGLAGKVRLGALGLLLVASMLAAGCALFDLNKELAEYETTYGLVGEIVDYGSHRGPVIVVLVTESQGREDIVEYTLPEDTGHFSFIVAPGAYYLAAFEDLNGNYLCDENEPAGTYGRPEWIVVPAATKSIVDLDIRLSLSSRLPSGFPADVHLEPFKGTSFGKFGNITRLDDPVFSPENGAVGYWKPLSFLKQYGIGVYFTEPYDPEKTPVLFVHGAVGTPAGWETIVSSLDRRAYQPWLYYYPSGLRLDSVAGALNFVVRKLHDKYGFDTLHVVAHSMGGLVSRAFIMKSVHEERQEYLKLFVSISTPWNGAATAAKGVAGSPAVVPSWHDMIPDGEFIRSIYGKKWPDEIKFFLLFSTRGDCSLMMANNDGTVEIASQLDYRAQKDADKIFGYDEDHGSVLTSPEVIDRLNKILRSQRPQKQARMLGQH